MLTIIRKYRALSFEKKTLLTTVFSIFLNAFLAIGKLILAFFRGIFFFVSGVLNIFFLMAKIECYFGEKYPRKKSFNYRNNLISLFLLLAGIQYSIYMGRLIYSNVAIMKYDILLGCGIALVSFIEMGTAIKGCFKASRKGHFYRNIKLINLCSALTAIVLTEIAIMSFASNTDSRLINGIVGLVAGLVIVLIAIYIYFSPKFLIYGKEYNVFLNEKNPIKEKTITIYLTNHKIYGNYYYQGKTDNTVIYGRIEKSHNPFGKLPLTAKIFIILFSEILIFPYGILSLFLHFKNHNLLNILNKKMLELNYINTTNEEDRFQSINFL